MIRTHCQIGIFLVFMCWNSSANAQADTSSWSLQVTKEGKYKTRSHILREKPVNIFTYWGKEYRKEPYRVISDSSFVIASDTLLFRYVAYITGQPQKSRTNRLIGYPLAAIGAFLGTSGLIGLPLTLDQDSYFSIPPAAPVAMMAVGLTAATTGYLMAGMKRRFSARSGWRLSAVKK